MRSIKLISILLIVFWLGYQAKEVEFFPVHEFIEKNFNPQEKVIDNISVYDDLNKKIKVECPVPNESFVIVVLGQSNSANSAGHRFASSSKEQIFNYYDDSCYVASDPMLGATGNSGSLWIPVAKKLSITKPIIILTMGVGGSKVEEWLNPNKLGNFYEKTIHGFKVKYPNPDFVIWLQGSADKNTPNNIFQNQLDDWLKKLKHDFYFSKIGVVGHSYCKGSDSSITKVQELLAKKNGLVFLGNMDDFSDDEFRYDDCHLSMRGVDAVSNMIAQGIRQSIN